MGLWVLTGDGHAQRGRSVEPADWQPAVAAVASSSDEGPGRGVEAGVVVENHDGLQDLGEGCAGPRAACRGERANGVDEAGAVLRLHHQRRSTGGP